MCCKLVQAPRVPARVRVVRTQTPLLPSEGELYVKRGKRVASTRHRLVVGPWEPGNNLREKRKVGGGKKRRSRKKKKEENFKMDSHITPDDANAWLRHMGRQRGPAESSGHSRLLARTFSPKISHGFHPEMFWYRWNRLGSHYKVRPKKSLGKASFRALYLPTFASFVETTTS